MTTEQHDSKTEGRSGESSGAASPSDLPAREAIEQATGSLIKGERGGISWGGNFYVEGNHESIDEVREMMFAKTRCEALDKMISEKQLVRPTVPLSQGNGEAVGWLEELNELSRHAWTIQGGLGSVGKDKADQLLVPPDANITLGDLRSLMKTVRKLFERYAAPPSQPEGVREALDAARKDLISGRLLQSTLDKIDIVLEATTPSRGLVEAAEWQRLRTALGYFLNAEAYYSTFPDNEEDAKQLRKSGTYSMLTGRNLLTDDDKVLCNLAMKAHAVSQPEFKEAINSMRESLSAKGGAG